MLESSVIKFQALRTATLLKRDSNTGILLWILWIVQKHLLFVEDVWTAGSETPVRLFKNTCLTEHFQWLLLTVPGFQPAALLKKGLQQRHFSVRFAKIFKNIFLQNISGWLLLSTWPVILRSFSNHLIFRAPLGNSLFYAQVLEFQPPDKIKNISQALFKHLKRDVASYSEAFIYLKSLKIICE